MVMKRLTSPHSTSETRSGDARRSGEVEGREKGWGVGGWGGGGGGSGFADVCTDVGHRRL